MKTLTAFLVAAALVAPQAALAQRHTTPGQAERHAAAQAKAQGKQASETTVLFANKDERESASHVNAAKAGKINTAKSDTNS